VCLQLVARCERQPGQLLILIGDKNFRGKDSTPAESDDRPRRAAQNTTGSNVSENHRN
jgi:hypothetical protein